MRDDTLMIEDLRHQVFNLRQRIETLERENAALRREIANRTTVRIPRPERPHAC